MVSHYSPAAKSASNALMGGDMARMRELAKDMNRVLREQRQLLRAESNVE